jgi:hypothetical protein
MNDRFWGCLKPTRDASVVVVVQTQESLPGHTYHGKEIPFVGGMYLLHVDKYGATQSTPWISSLVWLSWEAMIERLNVEVTVFGVAPPHGIDWRDHTHARLITGEP